MYDVALWKAPTFWHRDGAVFLTAEASLTAGTCQKRSRAIEMPRVPDELNF
jgi:hypothetical protein